MNNHAQTRSLESLQRPHQSVALPCVDLDAQHTGELATEVAHAAFQPVATMVRHARGDGLHEARTVRANHGHDEGGEHHSSNSTFQ